MHKDIAPWQVLDSKITYEDPWIRLRSDTCQTMNGHIVTPYHVIELPAWANIVALTPDNKIVLAREYRHGAGQVLSGLPGGVIESFDTDPLAAIQRELQEETGYSSNAIFPIGQGYANPANQNNIIYAFLALDVVQTHSQKLDEAEHIEIVLQEFLEFSRQAWSGELPAQALHLATLGFAEHFIMRSNLPQLKRLREMLLQ